jgi:ribonuclease P protein component
LTHRDDFAAAIRQGRRAGRTLVVAHVLLADPAENAPPPARVGFVVSRAVGGSVVRHRVARRLRHLMRDRMAALPAGARVVVRALPAAATAASAGLAVDLDRALRAALTAPARR